MSVGVVCERDAHTEMSGIKKLSWKMEEGATTSFFCTRKP